MKINVDLSQYHEHPGVETEFSVAELKRLRLVNRRLRFLEQQIRERGANESTTGASQFAEWEVEALEWLLKEVGYLDEARITHPAV